MKIFHTIPETENAKSFFNRYAGTIHTLKKLRTPAQLISAITEFSVLYSICFNAVFDLNPTLAHKVGLIGGVLGTILLEAIIRASTGKAIAEWLDKVNSNKTLRLLLSFIAIAAVFSSGWLSFKGSSDIANAIAIEPELVTTIETDSLNAIELNALQASYSIDSANVVQRFQTDLKAKETAYNASIQAAKREKQNYRNKERRTGNSYASKIEATKLKIDELEAEKASILATIQSDMSNELAILSKSFKADQKALKGDYKASIAAIEKSNSNVLEESEATIKARGKSFGWITIVCLFFFVLITWCDEIVKHHSEQKEVALLPEFANRENSWLEIWKGFAAKNERWRRKLAAKWTDHSGKDIELPYKTAFDVSANYHLLEKLVQEITEERRRAGFHHYDNESKDQFLETEQARKEADYYNLTDNEIYYIETENYHSIREKFDALKAENEQLKRVVQKGEKGRPLNPTFSDNQKQDSHLQNLCKKYAKHKKLFASADSKIMDAELAGKKVNRNTVNSRKRQAANMEKLQKEIIAYCNKTGQSVNYEFYQKAQ